VVFYAHSIKDKDKDKWHLLKDHLQETASIASKNASKFNSEKIAYLAGILHDAGKYAPEFQRRLEGKGGKVDHSTAGAVVAEKNFKSLGRLIAYIVSGHHSGIPDWGSEADDSALASRLNKKLCNYSAFEEEIDIPSISEQSFPKLSTINGEGFTVHFLIRFLYSCLVDADFLDTEKALDVSKSALREKDYSLKTLNKVLDDSIDIICAKSQDTHINHKRKEILDSCRQKSLHNPGLFTLTVPTGGGKTLSSLSFALRHAVKHGKDRIIYVIPYTSIIEQNAKVFKDILGEEYVLEHHSNFAFPGESKWEAQGEFAGKLEDKLKLSAENWEMPLIVTTNVQFFESLYASRSSKCRKLHNVTNSVIIVDEAQMIPTGFLKPCLSALSELTLNFNSTVVLCTATQPAIQKLLPEGVEPIEIVDEPEDLYQNFKRVKVENIGDISDEELVDMLRKNNQALCIVNSKKHARLIFEQLKEKCCGEDCFHLSTRMCAAHRTEVLKVIKQRLEDNLPCRVISTQLIEAGVDVDFPVVYRSMAGIDSVAQAAGRCNREGKLNMGVAYVFYPENHGMPKGWLKRTAELGKTALERTHDPLKPTEVESYFSALYEIEDEKLDKEGVIPKIKEQERALQFPFRTIAESFKLINEFTSTVIIPWDEDCRTILADVEYSHFPGGYVRKLQKYGVEVYDQEFKDLIEVEALEEVAGRFYVLKEEMYDKHYSKEIGLKPFTESMYFNDNLII